MPLPPLVKSWAFQSTPGGVAIAAQGTQLATNRRLLRTIKNEILGLASGGIATAIRSSDGSSVANSDLWLSDAALVSANAGVAHSWIVLDFGAWQLLISLENASGSLTACTVLTSFAGFTGGTVTARPTATDERPVLTNQAWGGGADVAYRLHVQAPEDGSALWVSICTGGAVQYTWDFVQPSSLNVAWDQPLFARIANGGGQLYINSLLFSSSQFLGRRGSTNVAARLTTEGANTAGALATFYSAPDAVTGEWPMFGLGFFVDTVGAVSREYGVWPDVYHTVDAATLATGSHAPLTGGATRQWVKYGSIWRPNDGVVMLFS